MKAASRRSFLITFSLLFAVAVTACSSSPTGLDVSTLDAASRDAAERAATLVCAKLGLRAQDLELVSVEAVEWPDASLGLPEQGMMYAQVITPGHKVILKAPGGRVCEVHTSAKNAAMKMDGMTSRMSVSG